MGEEAVAVVFAPGLLKSFQLQMTDEVRYALQVRRDARPRPRLLSLPSPPCSGRLPGGFALPPGQPESLPLPISMVHSNVHQNNRII